MEAFVQRNVAEFVYCLETLEINPNSELAFPQKGTVFEAILQAPKSRQFIELCMANGACFYKASGK